ncbi:unnamed protein product [Tilletia caries]|uniref:Uncharacterized protein n=1 Tax=Tilletia caries TaxID=13290 RepID=A0A8T8TK60_9BASI|nr:hypothetical protein A4X03_0g3578 [Tilletia caries]CAD6907701.1 unnamed protein product [Tilletia controversa]CAD6934132.1 unnamed protein product [Tilletia caries]CAD6978650.1 unnamed protein product [Tilletia controversa]
MPSTPNFVLTTNVSLPFLPQDSKDGRGGGRNRFERGGERDGKPDRGGGPAQRRENWNKKTPKSGGGGGGGKDNKATEGANRKAVDSIKGKEKSDKVLGSVIGKKRKERREKKGGGR